ncbi:MAG: gluconate 2-dehydrogenase subunit 3 family protein [Deltaproteobacteria bacterium]
MPVTRRGFLKRSLLGGASLALAGSLPLALRRTALRALPSEPLRLFNPAEYSVLAAIADRVVPVTRPGEPSAQEIGVAQKADALLSRADRDTQNDFKQLLGLFDSALAAFLLDGRTRPFTALSPTEQDRALAQWRDSRLPLRRSGFQALQRLCAALYYSDPRTAQTVSYPGPPLLARADGSVVGGTAADRKAYLDSLRTAP